VLQSLENTPQKTSTPAPTGKPTKGEAKKKDEKPSKESKPSSRDKRVDTPTENQDQKPFIDLFAAKRAKYSEEVFLLFGHLGLICVTNNILLDDVAKPCSDIAAMAQTLLPRILAEYIKSQMLLASKSVPGDSQQRLKLNSKMLSQRTKAIRVVERALDSSKRLYDEKVHDRHERDTIGSIIGDGCILLWDMCLPLLQTNLRKHVNKSLQMAVSMLTHIDSNLNELRVALHLELALGHKYEDMLTKSFAQCIKAVSLDYVANEEEKAKYGSSRPMDRFILPLYEKLELKVSSTLVPQCHEDETFLLIEQARESQDAALRATLLDRAMALLNLRHTESEGEEVTIPAALLKKRLDLWAEVAKVAWQGSKIVDVVRRAASHLFKEWSAESTDIIRDRESYINLATTHFIIAETYLVELRDTDGWDLDQTSFKQEGTDQITLNPAPIEAQSQMLWHIEEGIRVGLRCKQDWIVVNGCIYLWNYFLPIFQDQEKYAPYVNTLRLCHESLAQVVTDASKNEENEKEATAADMDCDMILLRVTHAYVSSLLQRFVLMRNKVITNPTVQVTGEESDDKRAVATGLTELEEKAIAFPQLLDTGVQALLQNIGSSQTTKESGSEKSKGDKNKNAPKQSTTTTQQVQQSSITDDKALLEYAMQACDKVVSIFATAAAPATQTKSTEKKPSAPVKGKQTAKEIEESEAEENNISAENPVGIALFRTRAIIFYRVVIYRLQQALSKGSPISMVTSEDMEKICTNVELLNGAVVLSVDERVKIVSETQELYIKSGLSVSTLEIGAKLVQHAFELAQYKLAIDLAERCERAVVSATGQMTEKKWRWMTLINVYCGRSITNLLSPTSQNQRTQVTLRQRAVEKYVSAMECASHARYDEPLAALVLYHFRQVVQPLMQTASTSVARRYYYGEIMEPLERLLHFYTSLKKKEADQQSGEQSVLNTQDATILEQVYGYFLTCLREFEQYGRGLDAIKRALTQLPISCHKLLWPVDIEFRGLLGQALSQSVMSRVSGYNAETQARVWAMFGQCLHNEQEKRSAFQKAISLLQNKPVLKASYMCEYAIWLFTSGSNVTEATDILMEVADMLSELDDVSMFIDSTGKPKQTSSARTSARSNSTINRKTISIASSRSKKSALSKKSKVTRKSSSSAGEEEPRAGDDLPGPLSIQQLEKLCMCYVLLSMMSPSRRDSLDYCLTAQFYYMRMLVSSLQCTKALDRNFDLQQLFGKETPQPVVEIAPPKTPKTGIKNQPPPTVNTTANTTQAPPPPKSLLSSLKVPNNLEDWIGYEVPKEARSLWAKDSNEFPQFIGKASQMSGTNDTPVDEQEYGANWYEWIVSEYCKRHDVSDAALFAGMIHSRTINAKSVDEPCRTLYFLDHLVDRLKREGYHMHCLPLTTLTKIIAEDVVTDEGDLAALANIRRADLYAQLRLVDTEKPSIKIKEHVKRLMMEEHEMMSTLSDNNQRSSANVTPMQFNIVKIDPVRIPVRRTWVEAAQVIMDGYAESGGAGDLAQVRSLVQMALADSKASGDWQCCAKCYSIMARMLYIQGKFDRALYFSCKSRAQLLLVLENDRDSDSMYNNKANVLQFYRSGIVDSLRYLSYMTGSAEYARDGEHWLNTIVDLIRDSLNKFSALEHSGNGEARYQLAMIRGDIAHVLVEMGSRCAEIEKRLTGITSIVDLYKSSAQGLQVISAGGLEYGRVLYRYASAVLQGVPTLGCTNDENSINRTINALKEALQIAMDAKNCLQTLMTEAVPPITDHAVIRDDDHPVAHQYALTQLLCGRIQLLMAEGENELRKKQLEQAKQKQMSVNFPVMENKSEEETRKAMELLSKMSGQTQEQDQQTEIDQSREDDALAMFTGALNVSSSPIVQARAHCLMGQGLRFKRTKNRKVTIEQVSHHLNQCITACRDMLAVGYDPNQCVLELMAEAYMELVSMSISDRNDEIGACRNLAMAQSLTSAVVLSRILESCSFAESVDMCLYRLLRQCNNKPSRIERQKSVHQQLLMKSSSYAFIYEPILAPIDETTWPAVPDDVVLMVIQPCLSLRGTVNHHVLESANEIMHCAIIAKSEVVQQQPQMNQTAKSNSRATPSVQVILPIEEEPARINTIYRAIPFNYDHLETLYQSVAIWNNNAVSASNEKQSTIRDGQFIDKIFTTSQRVLESIFKAFEEDLNRLAETKKKLVIITTDEKLLELPIETCLDCFMDNGKRFEAISRDFSMPFFTTRLGKKKPTQVVSTKTTTAPPQKQTVSETPAVISPACTVDWSQLTYIVDPFCDQYRTLSDTFDKELIAPRSSLSPTWQGIRYGVPTVPSIDEFQKLLNAQGNGCFVYMGYNTFLEHIMQNASNIGNLDLQGFELAVVMDRVLQISKRKSNEFERSSNLMSSSRAAALLSMRGIQAVVSNLFVSSNINKNINTTVAILNDLMASNAKVDTGGKKETSKDKKAPPKTATTQAPPPVAVISSVGKTISNVRRTGLSGSTALVEETSDTAPPRNVDLDVNDANFVLCNPIVYGIP
jgi:hypothetical protein